MLKKFYDLTLRVSGSLYVTSNTHVDEIGNVLVELKNCMQSDDLNMRNIAVKTVSYTHLTLPTKRIV